MWSLQNGLTQLRSLHSQGGAVLGRFSQPPPARYRPLKASGDSIPFMRQPKAKRTLWVIVTATAIISLLLAGRLLTAHRTSSDSYVPSNLVDFGPQHPILQLAHRAESEFQAVNARQSKTFQEAVTEYQRRYRMPPPPHFDEWYKFAVRQRTQLIDEYDTIYDSLHLLWSLKPEVIRARTREALGFANTLMGASIRDGVVHTIGEGQDGFQKAATQEMISPFAQWLPDMDLAFNVNDEPRVLIPREDIERMNLMAEETIQSIKPSHDTSVNRYTRPEDLNDGLSYAPVSETRFNHLDHQQTWSHSRMSCPADTPARNLGDAAADSATSFAFSGINFVYNVTAFSDVCLSPSVRESIGLFNHPNVYAVSHDLVPIFSPSKLSTFHDILYPSPYYYADKTVYDEDASVQWEDKVPNLYWRGATSGGYSQGGSWRTLLRQSVLSKLLSPGTTKVLERDSNRLDLGFDLRPWVAKEVAGSEFAGQYDVQFTEIKQCDPADCAEMLRVFGYNDHAPQEDSWKHRYLLDMDGNALSGRFYALLKSRSLPLKLAYYREWHSTRLFPWKHYVPVSSGTGEYAELLRYFEQEDAGKQISKNLALEGRNWANKVVRKEDMQVYMFRLLLE